MTAFKKLIEEARQQLLAAQAHLDIWEALHPTEQVVDVLNLYKGFFIPTRDAHRDRFFIKTHNVTDTDKRAPSFHRILRMIRGYPDLAPDVDLRDPSARLRKQRDVLSRIGTFRDKRVAHWDSDPPASSILLGECRKLLEELEDMFNVIHVSYSVVLDPGRPSANGIGGGKGSPGDGGGVSACHGQETRRLVAQSSNLPKIPLR